MVNNCAGRRAARRRPRSAAGREVVVSRGQLVEIGGGFRIPEVVAQAGARLVEVGTTNRTRLADYARAIGPETGAILRVHPSNFRTVGFVEEVGDRGAVRRSGVPGGRRRRLGRRWPTTAPRSPDEPAVRRSVARRRGAGRLLLAATSCWAARRPGCSSGARDGDRRAAARHPLARALRIDKLSLAALEATLRAATATPRRARAGSPCSRCSTPTRRALAARAERLRARRRRRRGRRRASRGSGGGRAAAARAARARPSRSTRPGRRRRARRRLRAGDPPRGRRASRRPAAARPAHAHRRRRSTRCRERCVRAAT